MAAAAFRLNPHLDRESLAARFRAAGRVNIPDFLEEPGPSRLHSLLRASDEWQLVLNEGDKVFEISRSAFASLDPEAKERLEAAVHAAARYEFQYLFESIRVPDEEEARRERADALADFASFLSSPDVVALLRYITGRSEIDFADAQATAYGLGHFLSAHDDAVEGKNRQAAYVFGLSPVWRPEWGGLLLFHGADGHIEEAFVPKFNALTLFAVPQPHSVSIVAPFAAARRYSVTGWLRSHAVLPAA
ncbi:MAG TPA: 2OG-Fe(II) oxygenase family protein [Allosphingosinicella sp.]|jgi:Rps23 Pro-64 3,4-dihydroxylase Tpa1-like proline 4-hydroxylase